MAVIFHPKSEKSIAIAISLFIGAEIKNEKVTPIGILACTKPKKRGIALQVQKGVIIPNKLAKIFPKNRDFPCK